jgi:hypothetical protein
MAEPIRMKPWPRCSCGELIHLSTGRCIRCDFPVGKCSHCHQTGSLGGDGLCGICSMALSADDT